MLSILLALDGSPEAWVSMEVASSWARRFGATVTALGIVDEVALAAPEPASIGGDAFKERRDRSMLERAHQRVDSALARFRGIAESAGVRFQTIKRIAEREAELLAAAQAHDVLIMARDTHFAGPDEQESDRTVEYLLGACPRPIVAVPPEIGSGSGTLIAYSGGTNSAHMLQTFVANGLHQPGPNWVVTVDRQSAEPALERAQLAAEYLRMHEARVEVVPLVSRQAIEDVLLDQAHRLEIGLLAMGSHVRSRIREYFAGSLVHEVLSRAMFPVYLAS